MLVREAMRRDVKTIRPNETVRNAAVTMNEKGIGSLVVVSGRGEVVGIITERDILVDVVATGRNPDEVRVEEVMTKDLITITPEKTLEEAADLMTEHKIKKLPVIENNRLIGIITATDLIAYEEKLVEKVAKILMISSMRKIGG
jgi:CBS domain-containing protein